MTAEEILDRSPLAQLTPAEYLTVVDAIIDRTFTDDDRREQLQHTLQSEVEQRYYERQVASMEILPPLLPWFVKGK